MVKPAVDTSGQFQKLPVKDVNFDRKNPRIRRFLEFHADDDITDDVIMLALNAVPQEGPDSTSSSTTPTRLRESIIANNGIRQPIIVKQETDGSLTCIEGNTRLWIYRDLHNKNAEGDWATIPALVHTNLENESIDAIRLQAHLVGPRPWDAYSKAKYLYELKEVHHMPLSRIIDLCGGSQADVSKSIQAYSDMEELYRPLCGPSEFDVGRFSGFVEYQAPKVQQAILQAGFKGQDFAEWIRSRKIGALQEVRQLPKVLSDPRTKEVFLNLGMKEALKELDKPDVDVDTSSATLVQLANALGRRANNTTMEELREFLEDDGSTLRSIESAIASLDYLREMLTRDAT